MKKSSKFASHTTPDDTNSLGRYDSTESMLKALGHHDLASNLIETKKSSIMLHLATERKKKGFSQQDFAASIGVAQSRISHYEALPNEDITLGLLERYTKQLGGRIHLSIGKPMTHSEAVKYHFEMLNRHLTALADIATKTPERESLKTSIRNFQSEASGNLLSLALRLTPPKTSKRLPEPEPAVVAEFEAAFA